MEHRKKLLQLELLNPLKPNAYKRCAEIKCLLPMVATSVPAADVAPSRARVVPLFTSKTWVKVIAAPAVPDAAEYKVCDPEACLYQDAKPVAMYLGASVSYKLLPHPNTLKDVLEKTELDCPICSAL